MLLLKAGEREELITAALLHDTLEDTELKPEEIEDIFGEEILRLVLGASEKLKNRDDTLWEIRKKETIEKLKHSGDDIKKIVTADKLSNVKSMIREYETKGDQLWNNFNRGYNKQKNHYLELKKVLSPLEGYPLYDELTKNINILFENN